STVVPRSILLLDPILLILIMGGSRIVYRAWKEHKLYGNANKLGKAVLMLGGGEAAISRVRDLARSEEWRVVGILDDDKSVLGRIIHGVKVLADIARLPEVAKKVSAEHVIVAMPSAAHQARRRAVEIANEADLTVLT